MNFAVPTDPSVKFKESKKKDEYLDFAKVSNFGDRSRGLPESSLFNIYNTEV